MMFAMAVAAQAAKVVVWEFNSAISNADSGDVMNVENTTLIKIGGDTWKKLNPVGVTVKGNIVTFAAEAVESGFLVACQKVNVDGAKGYYTATLTDDGGLEFDFGVCQNAWVPRSACEWVPDEHVCVTVVSVQASITSTESNGKNGKDMRQRATVELIFTMSDGSVVSEEVESGWLGLHQTGGNSEPVPADGCDFAPSYDFELGCEDVVVTIVFSHNGRANNQFAIEGVDASFESTLVCEE